MNIDDAEELVNKIDPTVRPVWEKKHANGKSLTIMIEDWRKLIVKDEAINKQGYYCLRVEFFFFILLALSVSTLIYQRMSDRTLSEYWIVFAAALVVAIVHVSLYCYRLYLNGSSRSLYTKIEKLVELFEALKRSVDNIHPAELRHKKLAFINRQSVEANLVYLTYWLLDAERIHDAYMIDPRIPRSTLTHSGTECDRCATSKNLAFCTARDDFGLEFSEAEIFAKGRAYLEQKLATQSYQPK